MEQVTRRNFGKVMGLTGAALAVPAGVANAGGLPKPAPRPTIKYTGVSKWTVGGTALAGLGSFDATVKSFMQARNIPCGSLAVTRGGKLVLARGYTWSDNTKLLTQPTSLFRIASLSKPFTATAILRLVQDGKLSLSAKVADLLGLSTTADARLKDVTVLRLLQHLGGWDRGISPDLVWYDLAIAKSLGKKPPVTRADIIKYASAHKLDHAPGTTYAYSNYGYLLLGQIIEKVTGGTYEKYVTDHVLTPMKIKRMKLGLSSGKATGEVPYYSQYKTTTTLDASGTLVPSQYAFNMANNFANGGWLASAVDLTRFATIYDRKTSVLTSASVTRALAKPETGVLPDGYWYGTGWMVRPVTGGTNVWHDGSMPGTSTLLVRRFDGLTWAVLFDQRDDASGKSYGDIDLALHQAANAVKTWPTGDLSSKYF